MLHLKFLRISPCIFSAITRAEYEWEETVLTKAIGVLNKNVNLSQADFNPNVALTDPSQKSFSQSLIASIFAKVVSAHPYTHMLTVVPLN